MTHRRSALVTGGTRGIGRGIAHRLAEREFGITITARNTEALEQEVDALEALGAPQVVAVAADMSDRRALPALVASHADMFGSMSALVLNAGVGTAGSLANASLTRVDKTFATNFTAALILVQESIPHLRRGAELDPRHGALVLALSSLTGVYAEPGLAAYGASKAALISLMETLSREEADNGIHATSIAPGYVNTDLSAWTTDTVPAPSMIPVEDVVSVADMLLSLSRRTAIPQVLMTRSNSDGYRA